MTDNDMALPDGPGSHPTDEAPVSAGSSPKASIPSAARAHALKLLAAEVAATGVSWEQMAAAIRKDSHFANDTVGVEAALRAIDKALAATEPDATQKEDGATEHSWPPPLAQNGGEA